MDEIGTGAVYGFNEELLAVYVDLDAFFASVELKDKPSLKDVPIIVGGVSQRGVVSTANYLARAAGVRSAQSMHEARRLCPDAICLTPRIARYKALADEIFVHIEATSHTLTRVSIDEGYFFSAAATARTLVEELQASIATTFGITASCGIAPTVILAKMASEKQKPNGCTVVESDEVGNFLATAPLATVPGIGPKTQEKLFELGLYTAADVVNARDGTLSAVLGPAGATRAKAACSGRDPQRAAAPAPSLSAERTFEKDLTTPAQLTEAATGVFVSAHKRLLATPHAAKTLTLKVRYGDFSLATKSHTLPAGSRDYGILEEALQLLLTQIVAETRTKRARTIRLVGISFSSFSDSEQLGFFTKDPPPPPPKKETFSASDAIPGSDVEHDTYGPGWVYAREDDLIIVRFEHEPDEKNNTAYTDRAFQETTHLTR